MWGKNAFKNITFCFEISYDFQSSSTQAAKLIFSLQGVHIQPERWATCLSTELEATGKNLNDVVSCRSLKSCRFFFCFASEGLRRVADRRRSPFFSWHGNTSAVAACGSELATRRGTLRSLVPVLVPVPGMGSGIYMVVVDVLCLPSLLVMAVVRRWY